MSCKNSTKGSNSSDILTDPARKLAGKMEKITKEETQFCIKIVGPFNNYKLF
jgi:hypothetical protein